LADRLGVLSRKALFQVNFLTGPTHGGKFRLFGLQIFQGNSAFGQFANDDFPQGIEFELIVGGENEFVLLLGNFPRDALEVETAGQLLAGHEQGVAQLRHVDLGNDVEGRHGCKFKLKFKFK